MLEHTQQQTLEGRRRHYRIQQHQQEKNTAAEQQYEKKTLHDNWCCFRRGRPTTSPPLQLNDAELWVLLSRIFSEIETQVQCGTLEPGAAQNQRLKGSTGSDSSTLSHLHLLFVGFKSHSAFKYYGNLVNVCDVVNYRPTSTTVTVVP